MKKPLNLALLSLLLATPSLFAQNANWSGAVSDNWNTAGNWSAGVPTGTANFNLTGTHAVNVDGATSIGIARFGAAGNWTFSGSQLTISNAAASSGDRALGVYNNDAVVTFQNEVRFLGSAASGESQIGANNVNGSIDFAGGIRGNSAISGFALRISASSTVPLTTIRGSISDIALIQWSVVNSTLDLQASSSVSDQTLMTGNNSVLKLGHNSALGTGTLALNHSSASNATITLQATGAARSYSNAITFNGGFSNPDSSNGVGYYVVSGDYNLSFSGLATLSRHASIDVAANRRFTLANTTGAKNLTKTGSGTMVLTGASIANANTTVSAGTLLINGTMSNSATLAVSVQGSGVLGGTGNIQRNVAFSSVGGSGGGLSPGEGSGNIGILNIGVTGSPRSLSLVNDSFLTFDLLSSASHDQVNIVGNLTLDGVLNINDLGVTEAANFLLFTYTGTLTNNTLTLGSIPSGWEMAVNTATTGQVWLNVSAVPEPAPATLIALCTIGLFLFRRRPLSSAKL
jgi:autotransporter-associated beta strand protein